MKADLCTLLDCAGSYRDEIRRMMNEDAGRDGMEENRLSGRLIQLTFQATDNNNEELFARSPLLDLYRGEMDEQIRSFARQAADWGHPFLFRLNNEMNSDWTSYGGVVNLGDPQIFISVWQRIYDIFQQEGVDNCIWIFNPNDRSAPPSKWNDSLAYCPVDGYFQMLGVTGYNNGTYYTQWAEQWREFDVIYDEIQEMYLPHFDQYPWIITEFASSSIGGTRRPGSAICSTTSGTTPTSRSPCGSAMPTLTGRLPPDPTGWTRRRRRWRPSGRGWPGSRRASLDRRAGVCYAEDWKHLASRAGWQGERKITK